MVNHLWLWTTGHGFKSHRGNYVASSIKVLYLVVIQKKGVRFSPCNLGAEADAGIRRLTEDQKTVGSIPTSSIKMAYEVFKKILREDEYFNSWEPEKLKELTNTLRKAIYEKYVVKCKVLQRDSFICQNIDGPNDKCRSCKNIPFTVNLTVHHIKFQKNGGQHKERNEVTVCGGAHKSYHRGKNPLVFSNSMSLPAHIRGHTFVLDKSEKYDWKKARAEFKKFRKTIKNECGLKISWEYVAVLLKWLNSNYCDYDEED